jgi:hypothetical protein
VDQYLVIDMQQAGSIASSLIDNGQQSFLNLVLLDVRKESLNLYSLLLFYFGHLLQLEEVEDGVHPLLVVLNVSDSEWY